MNFKIYFFLFFLLLVNLLNLSPIKAQDEDNLFKANLLYISGNGQFSVSPDIGELVLGIEADSTSAAEAQNKASAILTSFIGQLKGIGIQAQEIKTIENSLMPIRDYSNKKPPYRILSYTAIQKIRIKVTGENRLNLVSKAIDLATKNSINRIESISFSISPETRQKANKEALSLAAKDALETAKETLNKLGLSLIRIKEIRLSPVNRGYMPQPMAMQKNMMAEADSTPEISNVMPGELLVEGHADLVLEFKN